MAKKKKQNNHGADATDELLESTEDSETEAGEVDGEPVVPNPSDVKALVDLKKDLPVKKAEKPAVNPFAAKPGHKGATDLLLTGAKNPVDLNDVEGVGGSSFLNAFLFLLLAAAMGVGIWQLNRVSSAETLEAKRAAREEKERTNLEDQLAKQKKYGVLRIESIPPQASIFKNGEKITTGKAGSTEKVDAKTPLNMMDVDISETYQIRVELDGYEPFDFGVGPHLWTKESGTGEYKFLKVVELIPNACEYWFLYDAKAKKEQKFQDKVLCKKYYDEAVAQQVSVTDCTCKDLPAGAVPPAPGTPVPAPANP